MKVTQNMLLRFLGAVNVSLGCLGASCGGFKHGRMGKVGHNSRAVVCAMVRGPGLKLAAPRA